jgi:hypothetical protein
VKPVLDVPGSPASVTKEVTRLGETANRSPEAERRVIVVPDDIARTDANPAGDPAIVELNSVGDALVPSQ